MQCQPPLSTPDQEALLRALWEELDGPADQDVDAGWREEAQHRDLELDEGSVRSVAADVVFQRLELTLKK